LTGAHEKDNRNGLRRRFDRERGRRCDRHDHIHIARNQFGGHRRQPFVTTFRPAIFHRDVPPDNVAALAEALMKGRDVSLPLVERGETDKADHRHHRMLLCACRERPGGSRAANECNELAPLHAEAEYGNFLLCWRRQRA
jgi:hypothetical protein